MSDTIDTKLDANQVIKQAYDEPNKRFRVDATVTATLGDTILVDSEGDELDINPDGSLNANVVIDAASGDNIKISDGTDVLSVNPDGSINVNISSSPLPTGAATSSNQVTQITEAQNTNTKLDSLLTELQQKTEPSDVQNIRLLSSGTDSIAVPGVATASNQTSQITEAQNTNTLLTSIDNSLNNIESDINTIDTNINSINNKLPNLGPAVSASSIPITFATDIPALNVNASLVGEPIKISGTIDGTPSGTEYPLVYNLRQQILASHDRTQTITYADFGTKDQRITQIDYASVTFPGFIARKSLSYTLVGTKYRRDNINWTIV